MKRFLAVLAALGGCTTDYTDPVPYLAFIAGHNADHSTHHIATGDRIAPGTSIFVDSSWVGTCDAGNDPTNDKPNPCKQPENTYRFAITCTGGNCVAPAAETVTGHGSGTIDNVTLGTVAIDGSMTDVTTGQVIAEHRDLTVVPPSDFATRCAEHARTNGIVAVGAEVDDVAYDSIDTLANARPLVVTDDGLAFDLATLYPQSRLPNGDVVPGTYPLALQLGDVVRRKLVDVVDCNFDPNCTPCDVRDPL